MARNMGQRFVEAIDTGHRKNRVEIFGVPVIGARGDHPRIERPDALIAARPARVIFNPGTENPELEEKLAAAGIATVRACTLVLLRTGQFGS